MHVPPKYERMKLMTPRAKTQYGVKNYIIAIVVLGVMAALFCTILMISSEPKPPATSEQVENAIIAQGYTPTDVAYLYYQKDSSFKRNLRRCIAFQEDDIHFEFFDFSDDSSSLGIYRQAYNGIIEAHPMADPRGHGGSSRANFSIFNVEIDDTYNVVIYVGNTVVYAYCNAENRNVIDSILNEIDYLNFNP